MTEQITVGQAIKGNRKLQKQMRARNVNGKIQRQEVKPPLLETSGDVGEKIYFLKHAIKDTFKPHFERIDDLLSDKAKLQKEQGELQARQEKNKTGLNKKDAERLKEVSNEIKAINNELNEIEQKKESLQLPKGKIKLSKIKEYADAGEWEDIDFAIDLELNEEAA